MSQVADLLGNKPGAVHTVEHDGVVLDAIKKMVDENVGALIVVEKGSICGIFTERDYLRRVLLEGRTSKSSQVWEVMTSNLVCVDPSRSVDECMAIMTQKRIRHLPVMDGDKLVGIVSIGDLVKHLSDEREIEIRYLKDYIAGKYPG